MKAKRQRQRLKKEEENAIEPLSNFDILKLAVMLKIPYFDGVFMRDALSKKKSTNQRECWIINLGSSRTDGSHWTALAKSKNSAYYFDSFGKLPPPLEVIDYLGNGVQLYFNSKKYQNYGSSICGHLCLRFLYDFWKQASEKK